MAPGTRSWTLLSAAALALAAVAGCGGSGPSAAGAGHTAGRPAEPSAPPSSATSAPTSPLGADLADPLPDPLPAGTKVVLRRTGKGPQALDLSGLVGRSAPVTVHWLCAGGADGVQVTDRSAVVLGSGCTATAAEADAVFTGVVPPSGGRDLAWRLQAAPGTAWRIAVTVPS